MQSNVLAETETFTVISWGNGTCYAFVNKLKKMDVFFQGDDAAIFRKEWEARETAFPSASQEDILGEIWSNYSEVAQAIY